MQQKINFFLAKNEKRPEKTWQKSESPENTVWSCVILADKHL